MQEVIGLWQANQFVKGESVDKCGFYAVALCHLGGQLNPQGSADEVDQLAHDWYVQVDGVDVASNLNGIDQNGICALIVQAGNHYQQTTPDSTHVQAWLSYGYPVIVEVQEADVFDIGLGRNPYAWNPIYQHVLTITGMNGSNYLVHDTANAESSPRTYDASKLTLISATAFVPDWLPRPKAGIDPTKENPLMQLPQGWTDNGAVLTAPNGFTVAFGFRQWCLDNSCKLGVPLNNDYGSNPLEIGNPHWAGDRQDFELGSLGYTTQKAFTDDPNQSVPVSGVYVIWLGNDYLALQQQNKALQAQLAGAHTNTPSSPASAAETQAIALLKGLVQAWDDVLQYNQK